MAQFKCESRGQAAREHNLIWKIMALPLPPRCNQWPRTLVNSSIRPKSTYIPKISLQKECLAALLKVGPTRLLAQKLASNMWVRTLNAPNLWTKRPGEFNSSKNRVILWVKMEVRWEMAPVGEEESWPPKQTRIRILFTKQLNAKSSDFQDRGVVGRLPQ